MSTKKCALTLTDEIDGKKKKVFFTERDGAIYIEIKGYSTVMAENDTDPDSVDKSTVMLDFFDGKMFVKVWGDIENEDFTESIDLRGAKK